MVLSFRDGWWAKNMTFVTTHVQHATRTIDENRYGTEEDDFIGIQDEASDVTLAEESGLIIPTSLKVLLSHHVGKFLTIFT